VRQPKKESQSAEPDESIKPWVERSETPGQILAESAKRTTELAQPLSAAPRTSENASFFFLGFRFRFTPGFLLAAAPQARLPQIFLLTGLVLSFMFPPSKLINDWISRAA
jgi:hypothetical protein